MRSPEFEFEVQDVDVETTESLRERLNAGQSCLVFGDGGTGKTHAVRRAVNGAVWLSVEPGPLQQAQLIAQLASQIDGGRAVLEAYAQGDAQQAFALADEGLNARWLVVDQAELLRRPFNAEWSDPDDAVWSGLQAETHNWLELRASACPVVLVSRIKLHGWQQLDAIRHRVPGTWPIKLCHAQGGFREWQQFAEVVGNCPAGLVLGRAIVPFLAATAFNSLVEQLSETSPRQALDELARFLLGVMPAAWRRVLFLVDALHGISRPVLEGLLARLDEHERVLASALEVLETTHLVEVDSGRRIRVLPMLRPWVDLDGGGGENLLREAARYLLDAVNDRLSLAPREAEMVLCAHRLFLRLGDDEQARQTARLHVAGLVDLARRTSMAGNIAARDSARRQYAEIQSLLAASEPRTEPMRRLRSYVRHYHAFNGKLAHTLAAEAVHAGYSAAITDWPENALWHRRLIGLQIEHGRLEQARTAITNAERIVPPHPRRDTMLRIKPASDALRFGAPVFGLELVEAIIEHGAIDPDGAASLEMLLAGWAHGVSLDRLSASKGQLVFTCAQSVTVLRVGEMWRAAIERVPFARAKSVRPVLALRQAADQLAVEAKRLVRTPSHRLGEDDLRRKGLIIGRVDLLNSDIGLDFATHRWFLGRIEQGRFVPLQEQEFESIELGTPDGPRRPDETSAGLFMAYVPVHRDGHPSGPVKELVPAGSGRSLKELLDVLRTRSGTNDTDGPEDLLSHA